jgi:hypothetical protein
MTKSIITWWIVAIIFMFLVLLGFTQFADAHEGHGFKHMKAGTTTGPIIKAMYCPDWTLLNWIDYNNDGVIDSCKKIIFFHEKLHVMELAPIDNDCSCYEGEEIKEEGE